MDEKEIKDKNDLVSHRIDFGNYGFIQFQHGPRNEVGINGVFLETDVLPAIIKFLTDITNVLPSKESIEALAYLRVSLFWLNERQRVRAEQGVQGTYKSHKE